jgi:hypothetical protein
MDSKKNVKKLIGVVILTTALGAPAFAQTYDAGNGRSAAAASARVHAKTTARYHGRQSYAMSPRRPVGIYGGYSNYDDTGGGSPGYNEMLLTW